MELTVIRRILFVTAMESEATPILESLENRSLRDLGDVFVSVGSLPNADHRVEIYVYVAAVGNVAAAIESVRIVESLKPELTVFCGIAGGRKEAQIGDVVAASLVYNYESGKTMPGLLGLSQKFFPRPRAAHPSRRALSLLNPFVSSRNQNNIRVHFKPIACGEKVLGTTKGPIAALIRLVYGDALAVEMEGFGFLSALQDSTHLGVLLRGISDRQDKKGTEENHSLAIRNVGAVGLELIRFFLASTGGANTAPNR